MTTPKGKLFQIAKDCNKYVSKTDIAKPKATVKVAGKHYDEGKSISLNYSLEMYNQTIYDAYRHSEPSAQLSFMDDLQSQAFYVEPFESESEETIQVGYEELTEDRDMLDKVVRIDQDESQEEEDDTTARSDYEQETTKSFSQTNGREKFEAAQVKDIASDSNEEEQETSSDISAEPSKEKADYELDDDEFANDIQAILQGKKVFDPNQKKAVNPGEASPAESLMPKNSNPRSDTRLAGAEETAMDPSKNEHKIFEKIAKSMRYANSYDLGSIAMEKKFDQMENEIEEEEVKTIVSSGSGDSDIKDAEVIPDAVSAAEKKKSTEPETGKIYDSNTLLTPENGGRWLKQDQLSSGDILLITNKSSGSSDMNAVRSYAGIYSNGEMLFADKDGLAARKKLTESLNPKSKITVLRASKSPSGTINLDADLPDKPELMIEVEYAPVSIHKSVCDDLQGHDRDQCALFKGKVDIGTSLNDRFFISETLIRIMESAGLKFIDETIEVKSSEQIIKAKHNGLLQYAGHLKP